MVDAFGLIALTPRSTDMILSSSKQAGVALFSFAHGPWNFSTVTIGKLAINFKLFALTGPDMLEV
jgi:hypothetical protein